MSDENCTTYENAKLTLSKMSQTNKKVDSKYISQQLMLISKDIATSNETGKAQDMLNDLINLPSSDVQAQVLMLLNDNQTNEKVQRIIMNIYKRKLLGVVHSKQGLLEILTPWKQFEKIDKVAHFQNCSFLFSKYFVYFVLAAYYVSTNMW